MNKQPLLPVFMFILATAMMAAVPAIAGPTLDAVKKRGVLKCGVNGGLPGFSSPDEKGKWHGLDVDMCRAVATAVLGDAAKVEYHPLTTVTRLPSLQSGEVDLLSRNTTWTLTRDTKNGFNFAATTFYDGAGFMVRKDLGVTHLKELDGASICVQPGTSNELAATTYFKSHDMEVHLITIDSISELASTYESGRCDALTSDTSQLSSVRINTLKSPDDHVILPEIITKEPLGPVVRHGDDEWFDIVQWTVFALIQAEEYGITQANVDKVGQSTKDINIKRFLGVIEGLTPWAIDEKWARNVIKSVGNYGEIYKRNVGADSALKIPRTVNALWTNGGLMYAPPFR